MKILAFSAARGDPIAPRFISNICDILQFGQQLGTGISTDWPVVSQFEILQITAGWGLHLESAAFLTAHTQS